MSSVYITDDRIYVEDINWGEITESKVLEINTYDGSAVWHDDARLETSRGYYGSRDEYYITPRDANARDASLSDVVSALGKAICSLSERMQKGL